MTLTISLETDRFTKRRVQEHLSVLLPEWFAQSDSNSKYAAQSEILPGYIARIAGEPRGLLLYKQHSALARKSIGSGLIHVTIIVASAARLSKGRATLQGRTVSNLVRLHAPSQRGL
jgi:hypothetical protein